MRPTNETERKARPVKWWLLVLLLVFAIAARWGLTTYFDQKISDADERFREAHIAWCMEQGESYDVCLERAGG